MAEHVETDEAGIDRRRLLKQVGAGAAGAAVVWASPKVVGVAGAQVPSDATTTTAPPACTPQALNWGSFAGPIASGFNTVVGPTTFTFSYADPTGAVTTSAVDATFPRALQPVSYHMQLDSADAGPATITLSFSPAVTDLSFRLLDVDWAGTSGWQDRVTVVGATATPLDPARFSENPGPSATWTGIQSTTNSDDLSDIDVTADGPVTSVTITYARARATLSQGIGISNIAWCA